MTTAEPGYVAALTAALRTRMPGAEVGAEQIRRDRFRFMVIWDGFEGWYHPERQELVWDIAAGVVGVSDIRKVGMIITMAPSEVG
jgi:hypothetical protein